MAKRRVIVEIEYPDGVDGCWDADVSGIQVYHDTVKKYAIIQCAEWISRALENAKKEGIDINDEEALKNNQFYRYCMGKNKIVNSAKTIGYVDSDGTVLYHDPISDKFSKEPLVEGS